MLLTDTLAPGVTLRERVAAAGPERPEPGLEPGHDPGVRLDQREHHGVAGEFQHLAARHGRQAFATLDAGPISNSTPAATLTQGSVDPNLLASTPDANTTDPFIQEEAAVLDYDAQNIFNFLHNEDRLQLVHRLAARRRGTLWSDAGNALDVASLGVALMRASGIPAQYVEGTLSQSEAQQLILSMFPASYQTVGYIPAGTQTSDPANDPQLLSETEVHYWFQFDTGSGWVNADPLMPGATIGQTFTTSTGTFTDVPQSLEETTEVQLVAEITNTASP